MNKMPQKLSAWPLLEAVHRLTPGPMRLFIKRHLVSQKIARKLRFLTLKAPPPHLDTHPLANHTAAVPQKIATILNGPSARAVRSREIRKGDQNAGIFLYRIEGAGHPARDMIEKITIRRPEAMLSYCFHQAGSEFEACDLVPAIYGVTRTERCYHIFMEHLSRLGQPPDNRYGAELAEALARNILRFSQAVQKLMDDQRYAVPLRNVAEHGGREALRELAISSGDPSLGKILDSVECVLSNFELLMSHNDLHWGNIHFGNHEDEPRLCFIDFENVGVNIPGADLYDFARKARRKPEALSFFRHLSATYASLTGFPVELIRSGAYLYAAHHQAQRAKWFSSNASKRKRFSTQAISHLLEAQRELSFPGHDSGEGKQ